MVINLVMLEFEIAVYDLKVVEKSKRELVITLRKARPNACAQDKHNPRYSVGV